MLNVKEWCAIVTLCCWSVAIQAQSGAEAWLERMADAARKQNYSGVIVYGDPQHWDSFAIRHALIDGTEYEQLVQLTGEPREFLRNGEISFCAHEKAHERHHLPIKNPLRVSFDPANLNANYEFLIGSSQRIAGRMARQVMLLPRDAHRYGVSLWLDKDTGLLLRSDLLNHQRMVLERAQFAYVTLGEHMNASEFKTHLPAHELSIISAEPLKTVSWAPYWLPEGFKPIYAQENQGAVRLMYGDGLAVVSIYIDDVEGDYPSIQNQLGATNAMVKRITQGDTSRLVTAVGEMPANTLLNIIQSVQPVAVAEQQINE